jgi:hypothetical protein
MASILEFRQPALQERPASDRQASTRSGGATGPADIVLFPGVRYERWAEAPEQPAKPRRRARRRDHLDLGD